MKAARGLTPAIENAISRPYKASHESRFKYALLGAEAQQQLLQATYQSALEAPK